jgi:hypothetical protein
VAALVEEMDDDRHARGGEKPEEERGKESHSRETLNFKIETPREEAGDFTGNGIR